MKLTTPSSAIPRLLSGIALLAAALATGALCECSPAPRWRLADITHHLPDLRFSGMSQDNALVDERAMQGKIVMLYFGFTHCTQDCPIVMTRLSEVLAHLGPDAARVRVLFVSLDPIHDKAPTLSRYLDAFDGPHSTGLIASEGATEALAKRYRVAFYPGGTTTLDADLPHSDAVYIFDPAGHARLLLTPRDSGQDVEQDIHRLLFESTEAAP